MNESQCGSFDVFLFVLNASVSSRWDIIYCGSRSINTYLLLKRLHPVKSVCYFVGVICREHVVPAGHSVLRVLWRPRWSTEQASWLRLANRTLWTAASPMATTAAGVATWASPSYTSSKTRASTLRGSTLMSRGWVRVNSDIMAWMLYSHIFYLSLLQIVISVYHALD